MVRSPIASLSRLSLIAVLALALGGCNHRLPYRPGDVPGDESDGDTGDTFDDLGPSDQPDAAVAPDLRMAPPPPPSTDGLACPANKQYLLILDFRSGWWTAGGGATFYTVVMPFLSATCGGLQLEYHHYEAAQNGNPQMQWSCTYDGGKGNCSTGGFQDILGTIIEKDWTKFTQFWILSGDKEDPSDIGDGDAIFKLAVDKTAMECTPFLIGAGDGFITHGNVAANSIGLGGDVFAKDQNALFFSYFGLGLTVTSRLAVGKQLLQHPLFTDAASIADRLSGMLGLKSTEGDKLLPNPLVSVIGNDARGRPQIGWGRIPIANTPGRPFVLDAGMQRLYALGLNDVQTGVYLRNLVKFLGSIGCKSGEMGWSHK